MNRSEIEMIRGQVNKCLDGDWRYIAFTVEKPVAPTHSSQTPWVQYVHTGEVIITIKLFKEPGRGEMEGEE